MTVKIEGTRQDKIKEFVKSFGLSQEDAPVRE